MINYYCDFYVTKYSIHTPYYQSDIKILKILFAITFLMKNYYFADNTYLYEYKFIINESII